MILDSMKDSGEIIGKLEFWVEMINFSTNESA